MTADPNALISEGRKHDEAVEAARAARETVIDNRSHTDVERMADLALEAAEGRRAEWSSVNLTALLDGYTAALDANLSLEIDLAQRVRERDAARHAERLLRADVERLRTLTGG